MPISNVLNFRVFYNPTRQRCTLDEQGVSKNRAGSTRGSGLWLTQPFLQEREELAVNFASLAMLGEDRIQAQR